MLFDHIPGPTSHKLSTDSNSLDQQEAMNTHAMKTTDNTTQCSGVQHPNETNEAPCSSLNLIANIESVDPTTAFLCPHLLFFVLLSTVNKGNTICGSIQADALVKSGQVVVFQSSLIRSWTVGGILPTNAARLFDVCHTACGWTIVSIDVNAQTDRDWPGDMAIMIQDTEHPDVKAFANFQATMGYKPNERLDARIPFVINDGRLVNTATSQQAFEVVTPQHSRTVKVGRKYTQLSPMFSITPIYISYALPNPSRWILTGNEAKRKTQLECTKKQNSDQSPRLIVQTNRFVAIISIFYMIISQTYQCFASCTQMKTDQQQDDTNVLNVMQYEPDYGQIIDPQGTTTGKVRVIYPSLGYDFASTLFHT